MEIIHNGFIISDDRDRLQPDNICALLKTTYWADTRSRETIEKSIANSLCFGVYEEGVQIGFCRCVTDYATFFWLADVIIDESKRGLGLGKAMIDAVTSHPQLKMLRGALATKFAHGLYSQYGFSPADYRFMMKPPLKTAGD